MFYEALKANGVAAKYLELPSGGHGLNGYKGERLGSYYNELQRRLSAIPGVTSVSLSQLGPIASGSSSTSVTIPGFTERVMAKPGYAVGGVNIEASPYVAGFQVIFMRLDGKRLKPSDSYTSDWIRAAKEKPSETATYRTDGKRVIGIHGNNGAVVNTFGLIFQ